MKAADVRSVEVALEVTEEERGMLLALLERVLRDKQVEVHRTEAIDYRQHIQREATLLERLIASLIAGRVKEGG